MTPDVTAILDLTNNADDSAMEQPEDDATLPHSDHPIDDDATLPSGQNESSSGGVRIGNRVRYFGEYALLEEIARGGMGVVYKARQINLNRTVALKMILSGQFAGEEDVLRFHTEAEAAAQLDHAGIVPIFEIGEHNGQHYFSMGYIEGQSLARKVADGPLRPRESAELVMRISEAIDFAHERGVIHRDLKPANILIDNNGQPKVTDFGLAKKTETDSNLTGTGQILGTPAYMPPEQASGKMDEVGPLADVYSLGAVLYCLLCGHPPFQAANVMDTLLQVLEKDPFPLRQLDRSIPRDLETICFKALAKDSYRRYASAADFAADLGRWLHDEPIHARRVSQAEKAWLWCRRRPAIASMALAIAMTILVSCVLLLLQQDATNRRQVESLVDSLLKVKVERVPEITHSLAAYTKLSPQILSQQLEGTKDGSPEKVRLVVALSEFDASQILYLQSQVPACSPSQLPVVLNALRPFENRLHTDWWQLALDETARAGERFQVAAALAQFAPEDGRWEQLASFVSEHLTGMVSSLHIGSSLNEFQPAGWWLKDPLATIHADRNRPPRQREYAALALANYSGKEPEKLIQALLLSDEQVEFSPLIRGLQPHRLHATRALRTILFASLPENLEGRTKDLSLEQREARDAFWQRQALAAVAIVKLGDREDVWPLLSYSPNPSLRSLIIRFLGKLEADPKVLLQRLEIEQHDSIRIAIMQSLGGQDANRIPSETLRNIVEILQTLYASDPNPGVHSTAKWTLGKWTLGKWGLGKRGLGKRGHAPHKLSPSDFVIPESHQLSLKKLAGQIEELQRLIHAAETQCRAEQEAWERNVLGASHSASDAMNQDLIAHYPFDEHEGIRVNNLVAGQPHAEYAEAEAAEPLRGSGVFGYSVRLNRDGQFRSKTELQLPENPALSFGCWYTCDRESGTVLMSTEDPENGHRGFALAIYRGRIEVILCSGDDNASNHSPLRIKVEAELPTGSPWQYWQHLFATYDGSGYAAGVTVYLNGAPLPKIVIKDAIQGSFHSNMPVRIGARAPNSMSFSGRLDDVRVYGHALSQNDVTGLFENGLKSLVTIAKEERKPQQQRLLNHIHQERYRPLLDLRRQLGDTEKKLIDEQWKGIRRWYINSQGQTFIVVPKPVAPSETSIRHHFSMSANEVTVDQFLNFRDNHTVNSDITSSKDCPVGHVSWFRAAEYCNWLSAQEGIPEEQWVYRPNAKGKYGDGMSAKDNFISLSGYRLPTREEWEYACHAGTTTTCSFGEPVSLTDRYACNAFNSMGMTSSIGSYLPNELGFFDLYGNASEWCQYMTTDNGAQVDPRLFWNESRMFTFGGSSLHRPGQFKSTLKTSGAARIINGYAGIRLVRTIHFDSTINSPPEEIQSPTDAIPADALVGEPAGIGFQGVWRPGGFNARLHNNYSLNSGSLSYPGLHSGGDRWQASESLNAITGVEADLANPWGPDNGTWYLSFLIRPEGELGQGLLNGFFGVQLLSFDRPLLLVGKPGAGEMDHYVVEASGGRDQIASNVQCKVGEVALLVLKAEFREGTCTQTLFVNPAVGESEPSSKAVRTDTMPFPNRLVLYSTGAYSIDEIRFGRTFEEVTPSVKQRP